MHAVDLARPLANPRFRLLLFALAGAVGYAGLAAIAAIGLARRPPQAAFDLQLVLEAGRRVSAGLSPYQPGAVGAGTQAESLFYSYPPPVAQAASLAAGMPKEVVFWAFAVGAVAGLAIAAAVLARRVAPAMRVRDVVIPTVALAPFVFPFAVAVLFGNVDAWYPLVFGLLLVGVIPVTGHESRRAAVVGGVALGLATIAKLQPGVLLAWLALWGYRERRRAGAGAGSGAWIALGAAVVTLVAVAGASLLAGGFGPWQDYVAFIRAGTGADLVSALNIGPASQLALLTGDSSLAAAAAPFVAVAAVAIVGHVAWWWRDPVASLAVATTAALVVTPITWFHYPVALIPFAVVAWVRVREHPPNAGRVALFLVVAAVVGGASVLAPVDVWVAVVFVLAAIRVGGRTPVSSVPTAVAPTSIPASRRWKTPS